MAKIRTAARTLLTLDEKSEQRIFQGEALLRRMVRLGLLRLDSEKHIDFALTSPFGGGRPGRVRRKRMKS